MVLVTEVLVMTTVDSGPLQAETGGLSVLTGEGGGVAACGQVVVEHLAVAAGASHTGGVAKGLTLVGVAVAVEETWGCHRYS